MHQSSKADLATGRLFSSLWTPYDSKAFDHSVSLFDQRLDAADFDRSLIEGRKCLDAGCGGGRNSIGLARAGARSVVGIDLGEEGIKDARRRAAGHDNIEFLTGSLEELPFEDDSFEFIWCAGVLMHTQNDQRALDELSRVLAPGGAMYMLVYATGGMRWPLVKLLRPIAAILGKEKLENAVAASGIAVNKRRTFLDDLFVPKIDFYTWPRLTRDLDRRGFRDIQRWSPETRFDHEHSLEDYREDLGVLDTLFQSGIEISDGMDRDLFSQGRAMVAATLHTIDRIGREVREGHLTEQDAMAQVIGQGHHRLLTVKAN